MRYIRHQPQRRPKALVIRRQDGFNRPWVQCEECQQLVERYEAGVAWWPRPYMHTVKSAKVLCKTQGCLRLPKYRSWYWMELREFLSHLRYNLEGPG